MTDITLDNEVTEASSEQNTQVEKYYTQKEFDDHSAKLKASIAHKYEKKLSQLGDIDELLALRAESQKRQEDEQLKRGEFDKILQEKLSIKDSEIQKRDAIIREYKINTPLLTAASNHRAINAEQVKSLLMNNVRLSADGEVEVIDNAGQLKYKDDGKLYSVDDLVSEFLLNNSHFVAPTPATTNTKSNINSTMEKLDISKLNMNDPKHREIYKEYRKNKGIK